MGLAAPVAEQWRLVGTYTGRILKGDKPGDLPVQQSNQGRADHQHEDRQGARAHGPHHLAGPGDKVIE
jgi:hypothetical protein